MSLDVFDGSGFWQTILALLIHNIPTIILIIILIISWKREIVAGIAFILVGLLYIVSVVLRAAQSSFQSYMLLWILQISGIAFLMGILFLICWKKRNAQKNKKRKKR
jgi:prolipoprotein diacylglyceryltransferase